MRTIEPHTRLIDMHCHLGFVDDAEAVRRCLAESDVHALSCTVLPAEYERERAEFADIAQCTVALGLHPWQIAEGTCTEVELARFAELASTTRFIGEIGLDYAGDRGEPTSRKTQRTTLDTVLAACDEPSPFPRKLLSLHAVHAAADALDALEAHNAFARHDCIFHWFAGTSDELKRAIDASCYFSVGPRMLATKRGREYARIIPEGQLLLETDAPSRASEAWDSETWIASLEEALATIADIRNTTAEELGRIIARTSEDLLRPE